MHENDEKNTDLNPVLAAIQQVFLRFTQGIANGDAVAVANCYTEDAEFLIPYMPAVVGRENIRKTFQGYIDKGMTNYHCTTLITYNNSGYVGSVNTYTLSKQDGSSFDKGKAVHLFKKEGDTWKIFRDCFNSDLPGGQH